MTNLIAEQLNQLPISLGGYLLKDAEGNILYVGKAANLRHRVRSYFGTGQKLPPKLKRLVARVNDLDFLVTTSEQEALSIKVWVDGNNLEIKGAIPISRDDIQSITSRCSG